MYILMAVHLAIKQPILKGIEDGLLLIPRYIWNGWPGHDVHLVYQHAQLRYYIVGVLSFLVELLVLRFFLTRRRVIVRRTRVV
jgi:hypothetical protein